MHSNIFMNHTHVQIHRGENTNNTSSKQWGNLFPAGVPHGSTHTLFIVALNSFLLVVLFCIPLFVSGTSAMPIPVSHPKAEILCFLTSLLSQSQTAVSICSRNSTWSRHMPVLPHLSSQSTQACSKPYFWKIFVWRKIP